MRKMSTLEWLCTITLKVLSAEEPSKVPQVLRYPAESTLSSQITFSSKGQWVSPVSHLSLCWTQRPVHGRMPGKSVESQTRRRLRGDLAKKKGEERGHRSGASAFCTWRFVPQSHR